MTIEVQQSALTVEVERLRAENQGLKDMLRAAREAIRQLTEVLERMSMETKQ